MGNKASLQIQVRWEEADGEVTAGQKLRGMVLLNVYKPIYGGNVRLALYGKETSTIKTRVSSRSSSDTSHSERSLVTIYQTLKEFPPLQRIDKCEYQLPFCITIPSSVPSTQHYPNGRRKHPRNGFQIQYKLQATLGKMQDALSLKVKSSPINTDALPCMVQPKSFPISTLKLLQQGQVTLGASLSDTAIGRGESMELCLACRNDSTIDIHNVSVKLVEKVAWSVEAQGLTRNSTKTLIHLRNVDMPTLSRDRKERAEVRKLKKYSSQKEETYHAIYNDLLSGVHKAELTVPENARDSYDGHLVKISHMLHVTLQTRSISSNATVSVPVRIGTPRFDASTSEEEDGEEGEDPFRLAPSVSHTSHLPSIEIPVAHAVHVNSIDVTDEDAQSVIILSGDAVLPVESSELTELEALPPPFSPEVSRQNLLQRMEASRNAHAFVSSLLLETPWVRYFCAMSATDFAIIVRHVTPVSDQPRVAKVLAGLRERRRCIDLRDYRNCASDRGPAL